MEQLLQLLHYGETIFLLSVNLALYLYNCFLDQQGPVQNFASNNLSCLDTDSISEVQFQD